MQKGSMLWYLKKYSDKGCLKNALKKEPKKWVSSQFPQFWEREKIESCIQKN